MLYPLKFTPILKSKIWGGERIQKYHCHGNSAESQIGESWDVSAIPGDESVVCNGFLSENTLEEVLEVYMGDLVGEEVYKKYGNDFPLLVKLIDARDNLSIQVHPNDELAIIRHGCNGKNEMWYVMDADPGAFIIAGFKEKMSRESYLEHVKNNTLESALHKYEVKPGDVFYVPAGCVHSIGGGCLILEIQQTSDITYRIYDYNRLQDNGEPRELHTELALDAINFENNNKQNVEPVIVDSVMSHVIDSDFFTVNIMTVNRNLNYDLSVRNSFVILTCVEGEVKCEDSHGVVVLQVGESLLLPAEMEKISLKSESMAKLLEVYLESSVKGSN